jgi:hypothetical protein
MTKRPEFLFKPWLTSNNLHPTSHVDTLNITIILQIQTDLKDYAHTDTH